MARGARRRSEQRRAAVRRSRCRRRPRGRSSRRSASTLVLRRAGHALAGERRRRLVLCVAGAVGWFREVLPVEQHEHVRVPPGAAGRSRSRPSPARRRASRGRARPDIACACRSRSIPYSAGVKGGLVGGVAMAVVAGALWPHRVRQPLVPDQPARGGGAAARWPHADHGAARSVQRASRFGVAVRQPRRHLDPRRPALRRDAADVPAPPGAVGAASIAPLLWTGLIWASLGVDQPDAERAHRLAAGSSPRRSPSASSPAYVVARTERIETMQTCRSPPAPASRRPGLKRETERTVQMNAFASTSARPLWRLRHRVALARGCDCAPRQARLQADR